MNILTIPLRCARAKWLRTLSLFAVFTLGVVSIVALHKVSAVVGESFERKLTSFGANILVTPHREALTVSYGGFTLGDVLLDAGHIDLPVSLKAIDGIALRANLAAVAPKLLTTTRVGNVTVAVVGVDWEAEQSLKGYWSVTGAMPQQGGEVLAGATAASRLGLAVGSDVVLGGQTLRVTGVLDPTGSDDDAVLFTAIATVQQATGKPGQASFIEVAALCAGCPIDDIVNQLATALPGQEVRALRHVVEQRMYSVHFAQKLALSVSVVILLTACAMVVMSMLSAVNERKREIGILRSVGFARAGVFAVFAVEALLVGIAAGGVGYGVGHVLAGQVLHALHLGDGVVLPFDAVAFVLVVLGIAGVSVLAAAFPAWKAARIEPAEALVAL